MVSTRDIIPRDPVTGEVDDSARTERPFNIVSDWLAHFGPPLRASGKEFDADMEAASLLLALDSCGYKIVSKSAI